MIAELIKTQGNKKQQQHPKQKNSLLSELIKQFFANVKILLIFVGVLVVMLFAIPLAPFVLTYFLYDRKKKHIEVMKGKTKKTTSKRLMSVNDWANDNGGEKQA